MSLPHISPSDAKALMDRGAILIDIRDPDEHVRERISAARNVPMSKLCNGSLGADGATIVYHCRSGNRTGMNAPMLAKAAEADAFILDGGIEAWKKAGLPVTIDRAQPLELMRQVQIAAGGMALAGAVLGFTIHPGFYAISGGVGAGLLLAGLTGTCAMARILKLMPRNRSLAA
jgi:rhodanese-related sulfurtransferase